VLLRPYDSRPDRGADTGSDARANARADACADFSADTKPYPCADVGPNPGPLGGAL